MKKLILAFLLTTFLLVPIVADAAGWNSITATLEKTEDWGGNKNFWQRFYRVKIEIDIDGTDADEFSLSTYLTTDSGKKVFKGSSLVTIITAPGTTAPEDVTITFDDDLGADITSITTTSLPTQAQRWSGTSAIVWDVQIDIGDAGDDGEDIIIYLIFAK